VDPQRANLVIVGVGGTGGYVLQQVARLVYGLEQSRERGRAPRIVLVDGYVVEESNLLRQYFLPRDVGRNKADVLAERYGRAYGLDIGSFSDYIGPYNIGSFRRSEGLACEGSIIVGCVDNAATRALLHEEMESYRHVVYIDSGNNSIEVPDDPEHLDRYGLSRVRNSGWEGQVVAGVRFNAQTVIPMPADVFPDLLRIDDDQDRLPTDVDCAGIAATNPQRLMTNLMAATCVLMYLHTLLSEGVLIHHRTFFDARSGYIRSDPAIDVMLEASP
jgi:hypothetical protein